MTPAIDRLARLLEKGVITSSEFFNNMLEALADVPAGGHQAGLTALSGRSSERVRKEVVELQAFLRNQLLSRDFEHILRTSPLRPGICVELFACSDFYSSPDRLGWLSGRECRRATFLRFESQGENRVPVALVEFEEAIDMPEHPGRYGILITRNRHNHPAWEPPEGSVGMWVVESLPSDIDAFCSSHEFAEGHARYRVKQPPNEPDGSNG